jgi:hypothetical protein
MVNTESTVRMAPVSSQPAPAGSRPNAQPPRIAAVPVAATSTTGGHAPQFMLPVGIEESPKKTGTVLLTLLLLGIIGYSGYRVYPPVMDLWQRAHETAETPAVPAKSESTSPAANLDTSSAKPEAQPVETPRAATPAPATPAAPIENSVPQDASQPIAAPTATVKGSEATSSSVAENPVALQKPAPLPGPSPAHLLESKLHAELDGQPLAEKVNIQTTGNALTLSGSLTLAEHRELLGHLHTIPAGVRVIDDTEFTEEQKATVAPVTAGWIWVRSSPPGARILVDGAETGLRTPARLELQVGEHEVRLVRRGFLTVHRNVLVNSGQNMQFTETLATE